MAMWRIGDEVFVHATFFDVDGDPHRWSEATFGDQWETSVVSGNVTAVGRRKVKVLWVDGDETQVDPAGLSESREAALAAKKNSRASRRG